MAYLQSFVWFPNHSSAASCKSSVTVCGSAETWVVLLILGLCLILTLIQFSLQVSTINLKLNLGRRKDFYFSSKQMLINK